MVGVVSFNLITLILFKVVLISNDIIIIVESYRRPLDLQY